MYVYIIKRINFIIQNITIMAMQHSIIITADHKGTVLNELKKLPCIWSFDNSLLFKNELIIEVDYRYKNKSEVLNGTMKIEKKYTPVNYL